MIFISGNLPMKTEITPLLIVIKLEEFDYRGAAALGIVMLAISFVMLLAINLLQAWGRRRLVAERTLMAARAAGIFVDEHATRPGRDTLHDRRCRARSSSASRSLFLAALLFAPLATVFAMAIEKGYEAYLASFSDPDTGAAIRLTLTAAAVVVPLNTLFGLCGRLGDREIRVPRQELPHHADRPAARGLARDLRHGLRAAVRPAGLVRRSGCRSTTSASSSRCRASSSRPCS